MTTAEKLDGIRAWLEVAQDALKKAEQLRADLERSGSE
jgi:hypothetical protein